MNENDATWFVKAERTCDCGDKLWISTTEDFRLNAFVYRATHGGARGEVVLSREMAYSYRDDEGFRHHIMKSMLTELVKKLFQVTGCGEYARTEPGSMPSLEDVVAGLGAYRSVASTDTIQVDPYTLANGDTYNVTMNWSVSSV